MVCPFFACQVWRVTVSNNWDVLLYLYETCNYNYETQRTTPTLQIIIRISAKTTLQILGQRQIEPSK